MATRLDEDCLTVRELLARSSIGAAGGVGGAAGGAGPAVGEAAGGGDSPASLRSDSNAERIPVPALEDLAARLVQRAEQTRPYRLYLDPALLNPSACRAAEPPDDLARAVAAMFIELEYELACQLERAGTARESAGRVRGQGRGQGDTDPGRDDPEQFDEAGLLAELDGPVEDPDAITDLESGVRRGMFDSGLAYLIGLPGLPSQQRRIVALRDICALGFGEIAEALGSSEAAVRGLYSQGAISLTVRLVKWRRTRLREAIKQRNHGHGRQPPSRPSWSQQVS